MLCQDKQQDFLQFQKMPKTQKRNSGSKEIFPLRQSASMILFKDQFQPKQMLMFKRKGNMSFANAVVFPGGACDKEDIELISNHSQSLAFENYGKLTAIRQLYQQTGILLLPQKNHNILQKVQKDLLSYKNLTHEFIAQTWKQNLHLIIPLIRLVTVQFVKGKRFDTIFYTHHTQVVRINVGRMIKNLDKSPETLDLSNLDDLTISSEGQNYFWQSAWEILQKARRNQIILAPPQIIILSCLEKVKSFKQLENLNWNSCVEPMCMQTTNLQLFTFFGDKQYDSDKIIEKQPESVAKQSLVKYFQKKKKNQLSNIKSKIRRMHINLKEKSIVFQSDYVEGSLLAFLQQTTPKL